MLHFDEQKEQLIRNVDLTHHSIQLKANGFRAVWFDNHIYSENRIVEDYKFPHLYAELMANFKDAILDGEIALSYNSSVWEITKKDNWHKAKFFVFDVLKFQDEEYFDTAYGLRLMTLKAITGQSLRHTEAIRDYADIGTAIQEVKANMYEGLVIKSLYQTYPIFFRPFEETKGYGCFKWKFWKETTAEITGIERGTEKGSFITDQGKVSALSGRIVQKYLTLKEQFDRVMLEVEYLERTPSGKMSQPKAKRFVVNGQKVEFL